MQRYLRETTLQSLPSPTATVTFNSRQFARQATILIEERATSIGVYKHLLLNNGVHCHLVEMSDAPCVSVKVSFAVGSRNEAPHEHGAAHFLEHLFFRGQPSQPDPLRLDVDVELRGGYRNAITNPEKTQFEVRFPAEHAAYAVALISAQLRSPLISNDSVALEKGIVISEFMRGVANPFAEAYRVVIPEWMHPQSGLGHFVLGTPTEIKALTPETLQAFFRQHYIAENATVAIAGPAAALHDITPLLNDTFGAIPCGSGATIAPETKMRWQDPDADRILERHLPEGGVTLQIVLLGTPPARL